jgi:hypothetical protein
MIPPAMQTLVLISCAAVADRVRVTTIWATTADIRFGPRRTDIETLDTAPKLLARLAALTPLLFQPTEAADGIEVKIVQKNDLPVSALAVAA